MDFTRRTEQGTDRRRHTSPWPRALGIYHDGTKLPQLPKEPTTLAVVQELRVHSGSETKCLPSSCSPLILLLSSHLGGFSMRSSSQTSDMAEETPLTLCSSSGMPHLPNPEFLRGALQGTLSQTVVHESTEWDQHEHPTRCICMSWVHRLPRMTGVGGMAMKGHCGLYMLRASPQAQVFWLTWCQWTPHPRGRCCGPIPQIWKLRLSKKVDIIYWRTWLETQVLSLHGRCTTAS